MRKMNERTAALVFAALTVVGFLLRRLQLTTGYDAEGLPLPGAGILLGVYSSVVAALAFLYCRKLTDRPDWSDAFAFRMPTACASSAGAGLLLAGCALAFLASGRGFSVEKAASLLGVIAALGIVAEQSALYKNRTLHPMIGMLPIIFYIVRLIGDFKKWSMDPIILDYWVKLFAMLAILLAVYYFGAFPLGKGKRRSMTFFCLMAVYFCGTCLADGGAEFSLIAAGSMLWAGAHGWLLLCPDEDAAKAGPSEA